MALPLPGFRVELGMKEGTNQGELKLDEFGEPYATYFADEPHCNWVGHWADGSGAAEVPVVVSVSRSADIGVQADPVYRGLLRKPGAAFETFFINQVALLATVVPGTHKGKEPSVRKQLHEYLMATQFPGSTLLYVKTKTTQRKVGSFLGGRVKGRGVNVAVSVAVRRECGGGA